MIELYELNPHKMTTPQEKAQCVSWFIETKSDVQTQRNYRSKYVCMYVCFFISQPQQHKSKHKNIIKAEKKEAIKNDIQKTIYTKSTYFLPRVYKTIGQQLFTFRGVKLWYSIDDTIKDRHWVFFKKAYKQHLIDQY